MDLANPNMILVSIFLSHCDLFCLHAIEHLVVFDSLLTFYIVCGHVEVGITL